VFICKLLEPLASYLIDAVADPEEIRVVSTPVKDPENCPINSAADAVAVKVIEPVVILSVVTTDTIDSDTLLDL
jgi:hypothetical protein